MTDRIFLSAPDIRDKEKAYLLSALESGWIAPAGPDLDAFEDEISSWADGFHCVGVSSGTAALHLALEITGVPSGAEVFCSTLTFVATANAILQAGGTPVFIDSSLDDWNMDPDVLGRELADRSRAGSLPAAVVAVDLYGQPCNYKRIEELCARYDIPLIEDSAEALGALHNGRPAGSFGRFGVFSFNGNKMITASGGGMLVAKNESDAERARFLATQARDSAIHYEHSVSGYNYRLSNVLAALGRAQLANLAERIDRRRDFNSRYRRLFSSASGITFMDEAESNFCTFWLTTMTIDPDVAGFTRDDLRLNLEEGNIESRPVWKPMHLQPLFSNSRFVGSGVSTQLFDRGLCLPSGSGMTDADFERVEDAIGVFLDRHA